jgi:hypothetical protein
MGALDVWRRDALAMGALDGWRRDPLAMGALDGWSLDSRALGALRGARPEALAVVAGADVRSPGDGAREFCFISVLAMLMLRAQIVTLRKDLRFFLRCSISRR